MVFTHMKKLLPLLSIVPLALFANYSEAAGRATIIGGFLLQQLPLSPVAWVPLASIAVLAVITIAAMVYALSGIIGSANARSWSRAQIYEAILSLVLIIIFGAFSYLFFVNPQGAFSALKLVPSAPAIDCTKAASIFELATCDLSMFNTAAFQLAGVWFMISYMIGILPGISIMITPVPTIPELGFSVTLPSVIPIVNDLLLSSAFIATLTIMLLQQIQLIIISSSILMLSLFLTLGLIARTFGFAKTFGGAMIAFGLGLGLVYPLLVSITYGYVDVQAHIPCILGSTGPWCGAGTYSISAMGNSLFTLLTSQSASHSQFIAQIGYLLAGLTFIPFLNFIIVDAFIIDFSRAIGEQMDFMTLLAGII